MRILVANRGEIALRVIQACQELGHETVAIYPDADKHGCHRIVANFSFKLEDREQKGPIAPYLDIEQIISIAKISKSDAIHPGYGFLSENSRFAQACIDAGLIFIGPTPTTIELFGDKVKSRNLAIECGVPVMSGSNSSMIDFNEAEEIIRKIGFPVLIKAVKGGGGKGIRVVRYLHELKESFDRCVSEALVSFGDGSVFIEKYIENARHIEVQILGDNYGNIIHLFERDCTIQQRHQKVIEIAPCPSLSKKLREKMTIDSLKIARKSKYQNAGTVEFLLDIGTQEYFFIELNPRIQVEHTITEEITGIDLVQSQIKLAFQDLNENKIAYLLASLAELNLFQEKIFVNGFAIQCRVTREPGDDRGEITHYQEIFGNGIRLDSCIYTGYSPPPFYDSLLLKVIGKSSTFEQTISKLLRGLRNLRIEGITTNIPILKFILNHPLFVQNKATTLFLDQVDRNNLPRNQDQEIESLLINYIAQTLAQGHNQLKFQQLKEVFLVDQTFDNQLKNGNELKLKTHQGKLIFFKIMNFGQINEKEFCLNFFLNGKYRHEYVANNKIVHQKESNIEEVISPVSGVVLECRVTENQIVSTSFGLFIVNAMKMEHLISSSTSGVIKKIFVKKGDIIQAGTILATIQISSAKSRISTISNHLQQNPQKEQRNKNFGNGVWTPELKQIDEIRKLSKKLGGESGLKRQKEAGKLNVRERVQLLIDQGSFREFGSLTGKATFDDDNNIKEFIPANFIGGKAKINGRNVIIGGDDFSVRGGHQDGANMFKQPYIEATSRDLRIPIIRLLDGSSGGGSVATLLDTKHTYVPPLIGFNTQIPMLREVPIVSALLGPVVGFGAARAVLSHFSVMVKDISQLFAAGPPIVFYATQENLSKEELGGIKIHSTNGSVDNVAESEEDAMIQIKKFLSYLPQNAWELPPRINPEDDVKRKEEELLSIIPRKRNQTYDIRRIIELIFDKNSFFEIGRTWGKTIVVGFARLNGFSVGIVSSDCQISGGVLTALASDKLRRHVDLCNTFHIPVISLVDQPGFAVGLEAEQSSTIRRGGTAIAALYEASIPWFSVILRRVFGVAGAAFVDRAELDHRVAWVSGDWGSLPLEGGIEAAFKRDLENKVVTKEELLKKFDAIRSPIRTATVFGIEELIDPRDTRELLCEWIELAYQKLQHPDQRQIKSFRP